MRYYGHAAAGAGLLGVDLDCSALVSVHWSSSEVFLVPSVVEPIVAVPSGKPVSADEPVPVPAPGVEEPEGAGSASGSSATGSAAMRCLPPEEVPTHPNSNQVK